MLGARDRQRITNQLVLGDLTSAQRAAAVLAVIEAAHRCFDGLKVALNPIEPGTVLRVIG